VTKVTAKWVAESLFPNVVAEGNAAGLDTSGWTYGQHAGLSYTIMAPIPGSTGLRQIAIWSRWQDAMTGLEGMRAAFLELRFQSEQAMATKR